MNTTRRDMLRVGLSGLGVLSMGGTFPSFLSSFAAAGPATQPTAISNDNILVVVQLSGGNDGLNTVVPVGNDDYHKARPNLHLKDGLHKLNDQLSLNKGMTAFKRLFDDGKLAIINGCGYPQPDRSHFRAMEIWHSADPSSYDIKGWLGHYLDHALRGTSNSLSAINIGQELPQALVTQGPPVPTIESIGDFRVRTDGGTAWDAKLEEEIIRQFNTVREASPSIQFLSRQATNAIVEADQVQKTTQGYKPDAEYPGGLGQHLRTIAQIISANLGTRIFYCQVGGFDTHANQLGQHENLLGLVANAIAAFHKDLAAKGLNKKVTVMCFSEFGRRVKQNDSAGTDHGAAGPMFVIGDAVKPGIYGDHPSLTDLDNGDLKHTVDYRSVYATLLKKWLNADPEPIVKGKFEPLEFL